MSVRIPQGALALAGLRTLLKDNAGFNAYCGISPADSVAADALIFGGYSGTGGAIATIAVVELEAIGITLTNYDSVLGLSLKLDRETPTAEASDSIQEKYLSHLAACDAIIKDLATDSTPLDKLNIAEFTIVTAPQHADLEDETVSPREWTAVYGLVVRC